MRLPPHHVVRQRLTDVCADEPVIVVVASGGYGKSVLGAELVERWRMVGIELALVNGNVSAASLVARLHSAVQRAGYTDASAAMAAAGEDHAAALDAALSALVDERCAFVIDDAHHADPEAAALIDYLAGHVTGGQRCIVLTRHIPLGAHRLRRPDFRQLDSADLALLPDETLRLCRDGFGLDAAATQTQVVDAVTGGWAAATVLAAARASRTGEDVADVARAAARAGSDGVAALVDEAVAALPPELRAAAADIARLPLLDRAVVDATAGLAGYFERVVAAGLPFTATKSGGWDLAGPVRDRLRVLAPPDEEALGRAATHYSSIGELPAALELLVDNGFDDAAAEHLTSAAPAAIEAMDPLVLRALVDRLSDTAVADRPLVLIHLARLLGHHALFRGRAAALERATSLVDGRSDPALMRALTAEQAKDLIIESEFVTAAALCRNVLASVGSNERWTRASALSTLGRATCWRTDAQGRRDPTAMQEADDLLDRATQAFRELGMTGSAALLLPYRAMWVEYARGNPLAALERIEQGLALARDRPRTWASLLSYRFEIELELGRFEDCETTAQAVERVAEEFNDAHLRSYTTWNRSILVSYLGDSPGTLDLIRRCETEASDWWQWASADFQASSAECLARVDETMLAFDYLQRAKEDPQDGEPVIAMAEAVLEARAGDPVRAEQLLLDAPRHRIDPREFWRVTLFRALAAFRRDDPAAGALAARAFEEASRLGLAHLPLVKERSVSEQLAALAAETGHPAALAIQEAAMPVGMQVLGGFRLTRGGRSVPMSASQGTLLLKLLAVHGGRMVTDRAIDALWPDVDQDAGRHRLRTVLNRLRGEAGDVVSRDGEAIVLDPAIRVDLAQFEREAASALALGRTEPDLAAAMARSALARYRGDVLPDDPYIDWAEPPRERARRSVLRLLDLRAEVATERGDLDELRRVVELTIDLAPYDDERYLRAATTLLAQGRTGAALTVVQRARSALAELGLSPSHHLESLERQIVA